MNDWYSIKARKKLRAAKTHKTKANPIIAAFKLAMALVLVAGFPADIWYFIPEIATNIAAIIQANSRRKLIIPATRHSIAPSPAEAE